MSENKRPDRPARAIPSTTTRTCARSATAVRRRSRTTTSSRRSATSTASASPSASCTRAAPPRSAYFEAYGHGRRRADLQVHARQALPGGGQADRGRAALLDRGRRPRLLRGGARPARLRGEVLHRGRQLGPRRQQPRRLLHPRRDQVPGLHPLPEAGPGHLRAPGAQPRLRLHLADARVDAHGRRSCSARAASRPATAPCRASASTPTSGSTPRARRCWSSTTGCPSRASKSWTEADAARVQGEELGVHTKDLYDAIERGEYPEWELNVQIMDDHDHPELDFDPLDDTKIVAGGRLPAAPGRPHDARTATPENFFAESEQIAFGTGVLVDGLDFSDDKMLVGRTFSYSRHAALPRRAELPAAAGQRAEASAVAHEPARRRRWPTTSTATGENPHVNYEPSITGGLDEAPKPAHAEQGPEIEGRLTRAQIARTQRLQAGRRALPARPSSGSATTSSPTCSQPARPVRPRRSRSAWSGTCSWSTTSSASASARASASPPTTSATSSRWRPRRSTTRSSSASPTSATTARATSTGSSMTHCVPNEHARGRRGGAGDGLRLATRRGRRRTVLRPDRAPPRRPLPRQRSVSAKVAHSTVAPTASQVT